VGEGESDLLALEEPERAPTAGKRSKKGWIPRAGVGLAALAIVAGLAVLGQRWWDEQAETMLAALSLTLTASSTDTPAPTATPHPPTPTTTLTPTPSPTPYLVVSTEQLRVYTGPGENYDVVDDIHRGDRLPLCGRSADGTWWQVDYFGRKGWIRAQPAPPIEPTVLPTVEAPPTPTTTPTPTREPTPSLPGPNTALSLQNPGFEGIQENLIPGWRWWAEDNLVTPVPDSGTSFDTPLFRQADDPAGMISGPTLQIDAAAFLKYKIHVFQTVGAPPTVTVRFQAWAKAFSDVGGIKLAAGIDPDGGPNCSQARWGEVLTVEQSTDPVQLVAPDVAVGDAGQVTVCLYAETIYAAYRNTTFFDDAALIANPE
jgi:hypothetical protein